jgi:hypothetical protein
MCMGVGQAENCAAGEAAAVDAIGDHICPVLLSAADHQGGCHGCIEGRPAGSSAGGFQAFLCRFEVKLTCLDTKSTD